MSKAAAAQVAAPATSKTAGEGAITATLPFQWPAAEPEEAVGIVLQELRDLEHWLRMVECSVCEYEIDPREFAALVRRNLHGNVVFLDLVVREMAEG